MGWYRDSLVNDEECWEGYSILGKGFKIRTTQGGPLDGIPGASQKIVRIEVLGAF